MDIQHTKAILLLETLNQEIDSIMRNAIGENREQLTNHEVKYLTKMTDHIVQQIKPKMQIPTYEYSK